MARGYKCTLCKVDKELSIEEKNKTFQLEEMGIIKDKKYCKKHYEQEMLKKSKCEQCGKTIQRKDGVEVPIEFKTNNTVKSKNRFFCSSACAYNYEQDIFYKEGFIELLLEYFKLEKSSEIPKSVYIQMNMLINKYELSYKGMLFTMKYIMIHNLELKKDNIWLIYYKYDSARKYFTELNRREREVRELKKVEVKTKYFKLPKRSDKEKRKNRLLYLPEE